MSNNISLPTESTSDDDKGAKLVALRDRLMQMVDLRVAPTGIFHWSTLFPHAIAQYNGSSDARPMTQPLFYNFYHELASGALPSVTMANVDDLRARAAAHRERGVIPIAIANYHYTTARQRFVASVLRHVQEDIPFEIPDNVPDAERLKDVVETRHAFFASALLKQEYVGFSPQPIVHYGLAARFEIPPDCYLSNSQEQLTGIEIDLDDGAGWRPITIGAEVATLYKAPGTRHIFLQADANGRKLTASFDIEIRVSGAPRPNETWKLISNLVSQTGHAWVFFGEGHDKLTTPVLITEGFPGGYQLDFLWEMLNKQNLATDLLAAGKDIVIVGFDEGTALMENNAAVVIAAIEKAASEVKAGGNEPHLVVGGASMGGVVSCYALTYMERNNMEHHTDKYFSIDSPHTGAFVSYSLQLFVNYFKPHVAELAEIQKLLQSNASQELLLLWIQIDNTPFTPRPLRTKFLENLANIGWYPKKPMRFAVADGTGDGASNGALNGSQALYYSYQGGTVSGADLYTAPGSGSDHLIARLSACTKWEYFPSLVKSTLPNCESAPGGTTPTYQEIDKSLVKGGYSPDLKIWYSCFIPTISALAMKFDPMTNDGLFQNVSSFYSSGGGGTWLDRYTYSFRVSLPHVDIDETLAAWLYGNLKDQTVFVVNVDGEVWSIPNGEPFPFNDDVRALEIGISGDGTVWIVSNKQRPGGFAPFWLDPKSKTWHEFPAPAAAVRIKGHPLYGNALIIDSTGRIQLLHKADGKIVDIPCPHSAKEIATNYNRIFWIISSEERSGGYAPYWSDRNAQPPKWYPVSNQAAGVRVAVLPDNRAMIMSASGSVFLVDKNGNGEPYAGILAKDISVGRDGTVWAMSNEKRPDGLALYFLDWKTKTWNEPPRPVGAVRIAVL
jgi:hypothetical protein